jgi:hypothetical protein
MKVYLVTKTTEDGKEPLDIYKTKQRAILGMKKDFKAYYDDDEYTLDLDSEEYGQAVYLVYGDEWANDDSYTIYETELK